LEDNAVNLKQSNESIKAFIQKVVKWNEKKMNEVICSEKNKSILETCIEKKFILAFDLKLPWIKECL